MSDEVERKIMFYRLQPLPFADGSVPKVVVADILAEIKKLNFDKTSSGPQSRYCSLEDRLICAWPSTAGNTERVSLGVVRRIDLPSIDNGGTIKPLPIADDEGLLEVTHMQFFPNGIVGAEFNLYGPRATAFAGYVDQKIPRIRQFRLRPLLRHDASRQLAELTEIRMVDIRVHKSEVDNLGAFDESLPAGFRAIANEMEGESFEVIFRPKRGKSFTERMRTTIGSILSADTPIASRFEKLKIGGESSVTGKGVLFNLLHDQFIQTKNIAKMHGKTRAVSESKMYAAIEEAYNSLRQELEQASSVVEIE